MIGDIMTVSRLRMGTDGKGVTTLVTFYDCPLKCKYCINDFCHGTGFIFDEPPRFAYTPQELMKVLRKDELYYLMSGGGVTFGGGEPLLQSAFIHEVCQLADPKWNMRIETSLNVPWRNVEPLINDIDEWIIDIKDINDDIYYKYTGMSNDQVIDNIFRLADCLEKSRFHIRVPRIPGFNKKKDVDESVKWIKELLEVEPEVFDYMRTAEINRDTDD